ncbi:MAG: class II aldolase/adducin family protein, partial [Gammaproteobacteria bacterium]
VVGDRNVLVMRGHGVMVAAENIAEAFDLLYYFERSCKNQWLAMASGQKLYQVPPAVAEKTAQQWRDYQTSAHFAELRRMLDAEEPDYRS